MNAIQKILSISIIYTLVLMPLVIAGEFGDDLLNGDYDDAVQEWQSTTTSATGNYLLFWNDVVTTVSTLGAYGTLKDLPGSVRLIKTLWETFSVLLRKDYIELARISRME